MRDKLGVGSSEELSSGAEVGGAGSSDVVVEMLYVMHEQADETRLTLPWQLPNSVGIASGAVVVAARKSTQNSSPSSL